MGTGTSASPSEKHGGRARGALPVIWVAKLAALAIRASGRPATHLPGVIARRLDARIIGALRHPVRIVAVTGTNGKTTVSNLLAEALESEGLRVASNRSGSNIAAGVAATLIRAVSWTGKPRVDIAVIEMDERSAGIILSDLDPDILVCTNLTRDSIKRNAHPAYIKWLIASALPERTRLVLNADDLIAASLGDGPNPRTFFAVDRLPSDGTRPTGAAVDVELCPVCDNRLDWEYWRFNHIGKAVCTKCGFRSPDAAYRARDWDVAGGRITLELDGLSCRAGVINDNIVNVYNEIAVAATLDQLGIPTERIAAIVARLEPPRTRFDTEDVGDVQLVRVLTKGLVGVACSRAFDYVASFPGRKAVVLTIDEVSERTSDVENTAWTYDADYEYLADDSLDQIVVGGVRRHDQALRLAIAGVDPSRIVTVESEGEAAELVELDGMDEVFNLHSVHNALSTGTPVQRRLRVRVEEGLRSDERARLAS
jgi:Zn ribbon nucleic-acid-binding protein